MVLKSYLTKPVVIFCILVCLMFLSIDFNVGADEEFPPETQCVEQMQ